MPVTSVIQNVPDEWQEYLAEVKKPTSYKESFSGVHYNLGNGNCRKLKGDLWVYDNGTIITSGERHAD